MKNKKWFPKDGELYWYIDGDINWEGAMSIVSDNWDGDLGDSNTFNCFRKRKDALIALRKIEDILNKAK